MSIALIDADAQGHIWRYVDGEPTVQLYAYATEADARVDGMIRYAEAYPGERWTTHSMQVMPEDVPGLWCKESTEQHDNAAATDEAAARVDMRRDEGQEQHDGDTYRSDGRERD